MSFIDLEFMGIQSPDIMADSIDAKQMLLTLNSKPDWLDSPHSPVFSPNTLEYPILERLHKLTGLGHLDKTRT